MKLARGISVVFAGKSSHVLLRRRDVSLQFTEVLHFRKPNASSGVMVSAPPPPPAPARRPPRDYRKSKRTHEMKSVIIPYALDEIWSSEEYTCVIVHGDDQKPAISTHIFCDYILECHPKWMVGRKILAPSKTLNQSSSSSSSSDDDIFSLCPLWNQSLKKEEDIFMFNGEAFCSSLSRNYAVMNELWGEEEGRKVRVDHRSQVPHELVDSGNGKSLSSLGIPILS